MPPLWLTTLSAAKRLQNRQRLSFAFDFVVSNFFAGVAELADALDSKSSGRKVVWVRAPPPAMNSQLIFDVEVERNHLLQLFAAFIWEKTLPDRFVGITGFAFGILLPHIFQCRQRAILTGIGGAHCAGNVCQPWRRRFFFEF